ncbi:hypothetical protein BN8_04119 [Fibrisoma limi BUZ 3]|uniref:TonB-dependent receptor plug n=1 Tax=Fibrisoma limi BUZ 3 TaxID=1185876 RepID=I2GLX7_9BACT|nr:hypothetical protein BN8_04119 [Fibrisoma limi BUZ 3]
MKILPQQTLTAWPVRITGSAKQIVSLLFFCFCSVVAHARTAQVKGVVLDETNQPLPGVSILVKNTQRGRQPMQTAGSLLPLNGETRWCCRWLAMPARR